MENKIQSLKIYLDLLKEYDLFEDAENYISESEGAIDETVEILNKIDVLKKAQEEKVKPVSVSSAVREAIDQARHVAGQKKYRS